MDKNQRIIIVISVLFFMPFLGHVHLFDWDEINFAEIAREMVVTGDYLRPQINFEIFTEKPPLFIWLQAASMNVFGMNEYAARFPNTIAGLITLLLLYRLGTKLYSKRFGMFWALAYFGSILPHLYFRSGIIDPWFNLFIFLGIYHLILYAWNKENYKRYAFAHSKWENLIFAGIFTGLAILVKGPVAFLIISLTLGVFWILKKFKFYINALDFGIYTLVTLATAAIWFGIVTVFYGPQFSIEFTIRQWELFSQQDAGHGGFMGYHFVVLLIGVFPTSIFAIRGMGRLSEGMPHQNEMKKWMLVLFWVVLILFTIVSTKIVHYSSLAYFPMAYLAALTIYHMEKGAVTFSLWMKLSLGFIALIFGAVVIALPWLGLHMDVLKPLLAADPFAVANLDAKINWSFWQAIPGIWLIVATVVGIIYFQKSQITKAMIWLFGGTAIFVFLTLTLVISKIEMITQNAAIEFYETKVDCDCYVVSEEYKSYAQLFYSRIKPNLNPQRHDMNWLKTGKIDKDVFFVAKITGTQHLEKLADVELLYEKNGFTFWQRKAAN